MSAEIDTTTGRAAMAYVGETPWHGLGQKLEPGASLEEWQNAAGLNWRANRDVVLFRHNDDVGDVMNGEMDDDPDHHVLWRSDTGKPLSVVSKDYQIVQPSEAMNFFRRAGERNGFQMETAGALFGGRRIWALARAGEDAHVLDDLVRPYLLLATSYDGTLSTIAQFTSVRVVCHNTLSASLHNGVGKSRVRVPHSAIFKPDETLASLGLRLNTDSWSEFIANAERMARMPMPDAAMDRYLQLLLSGAAEVPTDPEVVDKVRASKGYQRIMGLFHGGQKGADQDATKGTTWGALHAVTQYVDWEVGRLQSNRLNSAWFGPGAALKKRAYTVAEAYAL